MATVSSVAHPAPHDPGSPLPAGAASAPAGFQAVLTSAAQPKAAGPPVPRGGGDPRLAAKPKEPDKRADHGATAAADPAALVLAAAMVTMPPAPVPAPVPVQPTGASASAVTRTASGVPVAPAPTPPDTSVGDGALTRLLPATPGTGVSPSPGPAVPTVPPTASVPPQTAPAVAAPAQGGGTQAFAGAAASITATVATGAAKGSARSEGLASAGPPKASASILPASPAPAAQAPSAPVLAPPTGAVDPKSPHTATGAQGLPASSAGGGSPALQPPGVGSPSATGVAETTALQGVSRTPARPNGNHPSLSRSVQVSAAVSAPGPGVYAPLGAPAGQPPSSAPTPSPLGGHTAQGDAGQAGASVRGGPPINSLQVQVNPPGWGPVDVRVQVQGSQVTTALAVSHGGSQTALWNHQDGLRQALGQHGLQLAGLAVGLSGQGGQGGSGQRWSGKAPHSSRSVPSGTPPGFTAPVRVTASAARGRLDLVG